MLRCILSILFACCAILHAHAGDACGKGQIEYAGFHDGAIHFTWTGEIANDMADKLRAAFADHKAKAKNVVLALNSCGGNAHDMEATIRAIEGIKKTHRVFTLVGRGATCSSACVFVFLSGERRYGALTSSWLFHQSWREVAGPDDSLEVKTSLASTDRFLVKFVPAGVSKKWLARMRRMIKQGDYWQTGRDLWESKSGIITTTLDNLVPFKDQRMRTYTMPAVVCGEFCRG